MGLDIFLDTDKSCFGKQHFKRNVITFQADTKATIYPITYIEEIPSAFYPNHLCNQCYLRSSYNDAGYDHVADNMGCINLYDIFEPIFVNNSYETDCSKENLLKCLEKAQLNKQLWDSLDDKTFDILPLYRKLDERIFKQPKKVYLTKSEAIKEFNRLYKSRSDDDIRFSFYNDNHTIEVFNEDSPIEIYGVIHNVIPEFVKYYGNKKNFSELGVVYKKDIVWYKQMSQIIIEFIEKALELDNPNIIFWG